LSIIKVITDIDKKSATNDMAILDGYVIKKTEYLAEQELSTTKQTTTQTDADNNVIGFESTIIKTSVIRLVPNINMDILKEKKAVLEKKPDISLAKENKLKPGENK
jgi:hypothetical protein